MFKSMKVGLASTHSPVSLQSVTALHRIGTNVCLHSAPTVPLCFVPLSVFGQPLRSQRLLLCNEEHRPPLGYVVPAQFVRVSSYPEEFAPALRR